MWYFRELEKNEHKLIGIITESDVIDIAKELNAENDENICSKIRADLALSDKHTLYADGTSLLEEPLIASTLNVLWERAEIDYKTGHIRKKLNKVQKKMLEIKDFFEDPEIHGIIKDDITRDPEEFLSFKNLNLKHLDYFDRAFQDSKKNHNSKFNQNIKEYEKFLIRVASLYRKLSNKPFTVYFVEGDEDWVAGSDGTRFALRFHHILNRVLEANKCKTYEVKTFKSTCEKIRTNFKKNNQEI